MPATLKDVVRRSGLSLPTVSRILGGHADRHSARTVERVMRAARELRYRPNSSARAVRRGSFGCICLLQSTDFWRSHLPGTLLSGIHDALHERDLHLTLARLSAEELSEESFEPKALREWLADGLLVNYTHDIPALMRRRIARRRIPAVWINTRLRHDCVHPDDRDAALRVTRSLVERGRRRIAYVDYYFHTPSHHYSKDDRYAGYLAAMREAGLAPRLIAADPPVPGRKVEELVRRWLAAEDRPDAVVTYGGGEVHPILLAAARLGVEVPRDLAVATFGEVGDFGDAPVTVCRLPWGEVGKAAVEMLLEKIDDPSRRFGARAVGFCVRPDA
jgi:LacI family fructose operon transcriptional repressor